MKQSDLRLFAKGQNVLEILVGASAKCPFTIMVLAETS